MFEIKTDFSRIFFYVCFNIILYVIILNYKITQLSIKFLNFITKFKTDEILFTDLTMINTTPQEQTEQEIPLVKKALNNICEDVKHVNIRKIKIGKSKVI